MLRAVRRLFWLLCGFLLVWFSVVNRDPVTVDLAPFGPALDMPLYFLLFIGLFIGVVLAGSVTSARRLKSSIEAQRHERARTRMEAELGTLREDNARRRHREAADAASERVTPAIPGGSARSGAV